MIPWLIALALVLGLFLARRHVVRACARLVLHSVYTIRVHGRDHVPSGGALLVANHLSFVDALLVGAAMPRTVHFLMHRSFFDKPFVGWFAELMGTLPVAAEDGPSAKAEALATAARKAADGCLVCIFAEGEISRSGALLPFARGLERIAREARVPIVPVGLDRVWGSIFSFSGGRVFWKWPQRVPFPVDVAFGAPLACDSESWRVRAAVQVVIATLREQRAATTRSLAYRFVRSARMHAGRTAVVDSTGRRLSYRQLLQSALVLRSILRREVEGEPYVGVLLPPSAAAVLANLGVTLCGRAAVNLNYTLDNADLAHPIESAKLRRVVTSRRFLDALERTSPLPDAATLFVEDLPERATRWDRLCAGALSLLPGPLLARWLDPVRDGREIATVIFSSGSTGVPKGVMLSHANLVSNVQSLAQMFGFGRDDGVLGVLPFFHSFGYMGTFWTPLLCGGRAIYHHQPLDAKTVGELVTRERATILMSTPTFYAAYLRRCTPDEFATLCLAVCGGEKLPGALAKRWRERFGRDLLEGYGCTELSPVVSINVSLEAGPGVRQIGRKEGSVGRALPGVALRIVDAESGQLLPPEAEGLVLVRGPNVMRGYLNDPERTREAMRDGWYVTGDVGLLDRDAFLVITDRVARFSKIGGEMVPHGRVEDALRTAAESLSAHADGMPLEFAVTSVPDEHKGERLVVVHAHLTFPVDAWVAALHRSNLPKLFVPRASSFVEVDAIPRLGSGKTDLGALRRIARERCGHT